MQESYRQSYFFRSLVIVAALIVLFCVDVATGSVAVSFSDIFKDLFGEHESIAHTILWQFRFPKAITCILAGAGLAPDGSLAAAVAGVAGDEASAAVDVDGLRRDGMHRHRTVHLRPSALLLQHQLSHQDDSDRTRWAQRVHFSGDGVSHAREIARDE